MQVSETAIVGRNALGRILRETGRDRFLDELITRMGAAISRFDSDELVTRNRDGFQYAKPDWGLVEWMPAMDTGRRVAIKTVGYHPSNPFQRGIPSVLATIAVYDCATGALEGIVEGTALTAIRTGAASALVSRVLAPDRALTVSMVGCGAQAVTQLHTLSRVRPVERVLAYDVVPEVNLSYIDRMAGLVDAPIEVVDDHARLLAEADVLCTCTSVGIDEGPVLTSGPRKEDLHINAVGADFAGKLELPRSLLEEALVVPDVRSQCLIEGECQQLAPDRIGPDVVELLSRPDRFAGDRDRLTVFDSTGWALEDLIAAELVLEKAAAMGETMMIDLQSGGRDPFDPYEATA